MACIAIPPLPTPPLPLPFSVTPPPLPPFPGVNLCCKLAALNIAIPPIPFPPIVLNPAVIGVINTVIATLQTYLDALPLECPRE